MFNFSRNRTYNKKKILVMSILFLAILIFLIGRVVYLIFYRGEELSEKAKSLQERERTLVAQRGKILDRNGIVLAENETVYNISVVHNQIEDEEAVIDLLSDKLDMDRELVAEKVSKVTSIEKIKNNVSKEIGDQIIACGLKGIKVDEGSKRYYPYDSLCSKVLGFAGGDNQGIIGLESVYEDVLAGTNGQVISTTDARGVELEDYMETRIEPVKGDDLELTIDYNIQCYCTQTAEKVYKQKEAESVSIIAMNPQNGEILAMVDYPEFDLNDPFTFMGEFSECTDLNEMWRNSCINDTYEPGSIFKIITTSACLEENVISLDEQFFCPGYITVDDRTIHCHKRTGHGSQTFVEAIGNSCNPVFISLGLRLGVDTYYSYFEKFELLNKTGIDLPGEAGTIMHDKNNMGQVELATVSFGQSFQITPIRLMTTVSGIINGGTTVVPHLAKRVIDSESGEEQIIPYAEGRQIVSEETSETMRFLLEKVVSEGGGNKAYIEGYEIGGKTATSQTIPRSDNKYISSFLGFAPADNPQIMILVKINDPQGAYYGGTIAAPVAKELFENILPYLSVLDNEQ